MWQNRIVGHGTESPEQLLANEANWRIHPREQQQALEGILDEVGYIQSVIVNRRTSVEWEASQNVSTLVDGHMRVETAISKGQSEIPVVYVDLTPAEEAKVLATFDPISALAATDKTKLDELLREVETGSEAVSEMLAELAKDAGLEYMQDEPAEVPDAQIDKAEELQKKWQVQPGDLWQVGRHRLLCGDSTDAGQVGRLLGGAKPFIMVTDPPYGVEYDPQWRQDAAAAGHLSYGAASFGKVASDDQADWTKAYELFAGAVAYVWHADRHAATLVLNLDASGFECRSQIIWKKPTFAISRGHYHWQHEPCWYAVRKGGGSSKWCGDRSQSTVWDISNKIQGHTEHGTQKPVECMARPIRNHGGKDDDVYDPFLGSGTTMAAAESLDRTCYGLEIEPKYCAVILERMTNMGLEPKRVK